MGPVETDLVKGYDSIHRKFFTNPPVIPLHSEKELLKKIHALELAFSSLSGKLSTERKEREESLKRLEYVEKLLKPEFIDTNNPPQKIITVRSIISLVSKGEKIAKREIVSGRRHKYIMSARMIVYYLSSTLTYYSLPQIGRFIGNRDHTTVLSGRDKIAAMRKYDKQLDAKLKHYETILTGANNGSGVHGEGDSGGRELPNGNGQIAPGGMGNSPRIEGNNDISPCAPQAGADGSGQGSD